MSAPRVFLDAFAKLLAPPPRVFVFDDLKGLWYAAVEMPETWQVLVGVSGEMFYEIRRDRLRETGRQLPDSVEITHVSGPALRIPVAPRPSAAESADPSSFVKTLTIELIPVSIERPAVDFLRRVTP